MAFWCRITKTKLTSLSNQFKRCYFIIPGPCLINRIASHARTRVLENPTLFIRKAQIEFTNNARFFAAPVQAKVKTEEKDTGGPRLNKQITAEFIRLVSEEGHRVVSRSEALECARRLDLDLVEVQRNAKPPVCKLMDYHKEKYKQQTIEKERAKSKSEVTVRKGDCKEVRFSGKIEQKDLQMKADTVKRLMERGYRVKCMATGTEDQDLGGLLSRLSALIEDVSIVESGPRVEKKQAYVIVRHVKFGPSKKGSGKKASEGVGAMISENETIPSLPPTMVNQTPIQFKEIVDDESGVETEDEILSDEAAMHTPPSLEMSDKDFNKKNPTWSVFDANDDLDSVFDFGNERKVLKRSGDAQLNNARDAETVVDSTRTETVLSPGYGMFSAPKANSIPGKNGLPVEVNRYKKVNSFDSTRHPRPRGVPENPISPPSNTDRSGRPGVGKGGQGKWGIFSRESSNVIPSQNSESQSKANR